MARDRGVRIAVKLPREPRMRRYKVDGIWFVDRSNRRSPWWWMRHKDGGRTLYPYDPFRIQCAK